MIFQPQRTFRLLYLYSFCHLVGTKGKPTGILYGYQKHFTSWANNEIYLQIYTFLYLPFMNSKKLLLIGVWTMPNFISANNQCVVMLVSVTEYHDEHIIFCSKKKKRIPLIVHSSVLHPNHCTIKRNKLGLSNRG